MSNYNINWEEELYTLYPNAMSNCYCGAQYPHRWHEVIKEALAIIEPTGCTVSQIKTKWGLLRLYIDNPTPAPSPETIAAINQAIADAERKVFYIEKAAGSKFAIGEWG